MRALDVSAIVHLLVQLLQLLKLVDLQHPPPIAQLLGRYLDQMGSHFRWYQSRGQGMKHGQEWLKLTEERTSHLLYQ